MRPSENAPLTQSTLTDSIRRKTNLRHSQLSWMRPCESISHTASCHGCDHAKNLSHSQLSWNRHDHAKNTSDTVKCEFDYAKNKSQTLLTVVDSTMRKTNLRHSQLSWMRPCEKHLSHSQLSWMRPCEKHLSHSQLSWRRQDHAKKHLWGSQLSRTLSPTCGGAKNVSDTVSYQSASYLRVNIGWVA